MIRRIATILILVAFIASPAYAGKKFAKRYPNGTALEVAVPNDDVTFTNIGVSGLNVNECVETDADGVLRSAGAACGAGGSGDITQVGNTMTGAAATESSNTDATFTNIQATGIGLATAGDSTFKNIYVSTGNIGINTQTPTEKLEIDGNIIAIDATFTGIGRDTPGDATFVILDVETTNSASNITKTSYTVALTDSADQGALQQGIVNGQTVNIITSGDIDGALASKTIRGNNLSIISNDVVNNSSASLAMTAMEATADFQGTNTDNLAITQHGFKFNSIGNLGTTGITTKYGAEIDVAGTADNAYGLHITVADADSNYAIWLEGGDISLDADNDKVIFGEGQDASVYWDTINMIIDPDEGDTGAAVLIGPSGTEKLRAGDATFATIDVTSLSASECVETDANGYLVSSGAACGAGGGSGDITDVGNCATGACAASSATDATFGHIQATDIGFVSAGDATFTAINVSSTGLGLIQGNGTNNLHIDPNGQQVLIGDGTNNTVFEDNGSLSGKDATFTNVIIQQPNAYLWLDGETNEFIYMRMGESDSFLGTFIGYDSGGNDGYIGVHNTDDQDPSNDVNSIKLERTTGDVTVFKDLIVNQASVTCIIMRDTDDAGWTECNSLNGTLSCHTDNDGLCDGTVDP